MNLVLFTHPTYLGLVSQAHFARALASGFRRRGHTVAIRQPACRLQRYFEGSRFAKWAGYVDQYLLFPLELGAALRKDPIDTLYVFCDQALGPWIPFVAHRPHVVHCHDLLALRCALGDIAQIPMSITGRVYQRYIRRGFRFARHFISISEKSHADLLRFGGVKPQTSEVVYNGLNYPYRRLVASEVQRVLGATGIATDARGCLLHIGGGQWYKNSVGVVGLYASYVKLAVEEDRPVLPLWMVSPPPSEAVRSALAGVPAQGEVRFFSGLATLTIEALYSHAAALLFPSHAEGFGWPIAEALACGCPVITTAEAPMTEVGGDAANYVPRLQEGDDPQRWADVSARVLTAVLQRPADERERCAKAGQAWALRFSGDSAIDNYLAVYRRVLELETTQVNGRWSPANES